MKNRTGLALRIDRMYVVMTALCNQLEAFASDLGDDQSRYLVLSCILPRPVSLFRFVSGPCRWRSTFLLLFLTFKVSYRPKYDYIMVRTKSQLDCLYLPHLPILSPTLGKG